MHRHAASTLMLLAVALSTACSTLRVPDSTTQFYVTGSQSIEEGCDQVPFAELAVACHRITPGGSTVIGLREYMDDGLDAEKFRKITLVVNAPLKEGDHIDLLREPNRGFYGTGLSYMPGKAGCYGRLTAGTLTVEKVEAQKVRLQLDAQFELKSPTDFEGACGTLHYNTTIIARQRYLEELGPWEGVPREADYFEEGAPGSHTEPPRRRDQAGALPAISRRTPHNLESTWPYPPRHNGMRLRHPMSTRHVQV